MRLAAFEYNEERSSVDIYISGCPWRCEGCHNPELWDYSVGELWEDVRERLRDKVILLESLVDKAFVFGGEPLDQDYTSLKSLLEMLKTELGLEVWLFTSYPDVPSYFYPLVNYIKTGPYIKALPPYDTPYGITLASNNQRIRKVLCKRSFVLSP